MNAEEKVKQLNEIISGLFKVIESQNEMIKRKNEELYQDANREREKTVKADDAADDEEEECIHWEHDHGHCLDCGKDKSLYFF